MSITEKVSANDGEMTRTEVARALGWSRSYTTNLELSGLKKLEAMIRRGDPRAVKALEFIEEH